MTIVVSIKVNDGVVLASDSATTFFDKDGIAVKVFNNANKVFNLIKGHPVGAMTFGSGAIGPASISTLSKDLRRQLCSPQSPLYVDLAQPHTVLQIAERARDFFAQRMAEAYPDGVENFYTGYRIFGFSSEGALAEGYELSITADAVSDPDPLYPDSSPYGIRWAGDGEALDRLILGQGRNLLPALREAGLEQQHEAALLAHLQSRLYHTLYLPAMPIQDAIDLARFLAETAARFSLFSMQAATIGGPIEIATITKHEGFRWVARKHYFTSELNPGERNG